MSGADSNVKNPGMATPSRRRNRPFLRVLITIAMVAVAAVLGWQAWMAYMGSPWTRDGTVRAYVVTIAPEVAGQIVQLPVADNAFVRKGDLLMLIDPTNYAIAVKQAQAAVAQTKAVADNAHAEAVRRQQLNSIAVTVEEVQTYVAQAQSAEAAYQQALANLDQARVNLKRTQVRSPVNGFVTNLTVQLGDYATVGQRQISVLNSESFWVDAYFEETAVHRIHEGDEATIKLMGYRPLLRGRVTGLARGINVPNAEPDALGLPSVNPIFTFVRLAQRVPVRIKLEDIPKGLQLVAGMTATVQLEPRKVAEPTSPLPTAPPVSAAPPTKPGVAVELPPAAKTGAPQAPAAASPPPAPSQASAAPATGPAPANPAPQPQGAAGAPAPDLSGKVDAEHIPASVYLGKTIDLFGSQSAEAPSPARAPESLRRRAHQRRRHDE